MVLKRAMERSLTLGNNDFARMQPRYARVANVLVREIKSGRFPVGGLLPTEAQLGERFEVSRVTVREALRRLEEMGLISKVHGIGSRVEAQEMRDSYSVSVDSAAEMMQYGYETEFVASSREELSAGSSELAALDMQMDAVKLIGVRTALDAQRAPLSYCEIFINAAYASVIDGPNGSNEPYYRKMVRLHGQRISGIGQEISAIRLKAHHAVVLRQQEDAPGLQIVRRFFGEDRELLEVTINVHPAENFSLRLFLNKNDG